MGMAHTGSVGLAHFSMNEYFWVFPSHLVVSTPANLMKGVDAPPGFVPLNHWPVVKSPSTKLQVNGPPELVPPSVPPLGALPEDAPAAEPVPPPVGDVLPEPAPDAGDPVTPTSEPLIVLGLPVVGPAPLLLTPLLPAPLPVPW